MDLARKEPLHKRTTSHKYSRRIFSLFWRPSQLSLTYFAPPPSPYLWKTVTQLTAISLLVIAVLDFAQSTVLY